MHHTCDIGLIVGAIWKLTKKGHKNLGTGKQLGPFHNHCTRGWMAINMNPSARKGPSLDQPFRVRFARALISPLFLPFKSSVKHVYDYSQLAWNRSNTLKRMSYRWTFDVIIPSEKFMGQEGLALLFSRRFVYPREHRYGSVLGFTGDQRAEPESSNLTI